jgi:DNA-binding response OmpR family regulator
MPSESADGTLDFALTAKGDRVRILIADADEVLLELLQSYFWDQGHEVEIAADALECMATLCHFVPDALVLDRELLWGGCDGVLAQMSDDPALAEIPTILITFDDPLDEFIVPSNPPLVARLRKPYRLSELLACINSAAASGTVDVRDRSAATVHRRNGRKREQSLASLAREKDTP